MGGSELCLKGNDELAVAHACIGPCYQGAVGRAASAFVGCDYVVHQTEHDLFLRFPDPPETTIHTQSVYVFLDFADGHLDLGRPVAVHCDSGRSTAPCLAMRLLARRGYVPRTSFAGARAAFEWLYPAFDPHPALVRFLSHAWDPLTMRSGHGL